jgi:hypothetical protein
MRELAEMVSRQQSAGVMQGVLNGVVEQVCTSLAMGLPQKLAKLNIMSGPALCLFVRHKASLVRRSG